jgi:hypothetical protein
MKGLSVIISFVVLGLVFSCDKLHWIAYVVTNGSNSKIKVVYNLQYSTSKDSTIFIDPKTKDTLYIREIGYGKFVSNPEANNESIWGITNFFTYKDDTIRNTTNIKLVSRWIYKAVDDNNAELNLTLTDEDFK